MKIKISEFKKLAKDVLCKKYYSAEEADQIIDVLMFHELSGNKTHGVVKLIGRKPPQSIKPKHKPRIVRETPLSALIDGGGCPGPLPAQIATDKVIKIAADKGFGIVGVNNTFSTIGALSYYLKKIVDHDLIGIIAASSPKAVLHHGGIDPVYGTNPIAYGFPTEGKPILFDMAASAITWGGLRRANTLGEKISAEVAIDQNGQPTTNPAQAMLGAILPFDKSYKGSGIAMVVEILSGVLTGASYVFEDTKENDWGTVFMALKPDLLMDAKEFKKRNSDLIKKVKSSRVKEGERIRIPGYDELSQIEKTQKLGEIEIEDRILDELKTWL